MGYCRVETISASHQGGEELDILSHPSGIRMRRLPLLAVHALLAPWKELGDGERRPFTVELCPDHHK
jgi:hypothetical protein